MDSNPKTFADITPDIIQDWKAKYGSLKQIDIKKKTGEYVASFIARKPSRTVIDLVGKYTLEKDTIKANNAVISNCILGGDMAVLENDGFVYTEVLDKLRNLADEVEVSIKNI